MLLPPLLEKKVNGYTWQEIHVGRSSSTVHRLTNGVQTYFLKAQEKVAGFESLYEEKQRVEWLAGKLPVPTILHYEQTEQNEYLLMTAIHGVDASSITEPTKLPMVIQAYAEGLKQLHQVDINDCPFYEDKHLKLKKAEANMKAGFVDETDFDHIRLGQSAEQLFNELTSYPPFEEDLVFTHGDYCLPNMMIKDGTYHGFIDLGRAGIADRYQDLALAVRSIESNFGSKWVIPFISHYGLSELNDTKAFYYQLLDEFF